MVTSAAEEYLATLTVTYEENATVDYHENTILEVQASTSLDTAITYQWYMYNTSTRAIDLLQGETNSTYTAYGDAQYATRYYCLISDGSEVRQIKITLSINSTLENISETDQFDIVYDDFGSISLDIETITDRDITYQWFIRKYNSATAAYDRENIAGATDSSYDIQGDFSIEPTYYCEVSDGITTQVYEVHTTLITIVAEYEQNISAIGGEGVVLDPSAESLTEATLTYKWQLYDEKTLTYKTITGAVGATYEIAAVKKAARYNCIISNGTRQINAPFTVDIENTIALEYEDSYSVEYHTYETLVVDASNGDNGNTGLTYKWYAHRQNEDMTYTTTLISAATTNSLQIYGDEKTAAIYECFVSDGYSEKSAMIYVTLETGIFLDYSSNVTVPYHKAFNLTVDALSETDKQLTYKWYYYDEERTLHLIEDAVSDALEVYGDDALYGTYLCVISDGIASKRAEINTILGSSIDYGQTVYSVNVPMDATSQLIVYATSEYGDSITYKWFTIEENAGGDTYNSFIEDATGNTLEITADKQCPKYYYCQVSNGVSTDNIRFAINIDSGLTVENYNSHVTVLYGEVTTLTVDAVSNDDEIKYRWQSYNDDDGWVDIDNATENTCDIEGSYDMPDKIKCYLSDSYSSREAVFNLSLDTGLRCEVANDNVTVEYQDSKILKVRAESIIGRNLTFEWTKETSSEMYTIDGAYSNSYEVEGNAQADGIYHCYITDGLT